MRRATFRFYGPLNDFLRPSARQVTLTHAFQLETTVKDVVESLGVPHTEIDLLLAGGEPIGFEYRMRDGDRIAAFPRFVSLDVCSFTRVERTPIRDPRFVLDVHLGRLASYLRLAGFDTFYRNDSPDLALARIAHDERRILLTRDPQVLKRRMVEHGYYVRETSPRLQLEEVLRRFDLEWRMQPFRRCARCNTLLVRVSADEVRDTLPERTRRHFEHFSRCAGCGRIYWQGSHWRRMSEWLAQIASVRTTNGVFRAGH